MILPVLIGASIGFLLGWWAARDYLSRFRAGQEWDAEQSKRRLRGNEEAKRLHELCKTEPTVPLHPPWWTWDEAMQGWHTSIGTFVSRAQWGGAGAPQTWCADKLNGQSKA